MSDFTDKKIVITGGGSGIGAEMALAFARAGGRVTIAGRNQDRLAAVAAQHENIEYQVTDITQAAAVTALFADRPVVDIVIANAGAAQSAPFKKITLEQWQQMLAVNLTGVFLTLQAGLARMGNGGRLMAVASTAGLKGYPYVAPYCAAKHGVIGLVKSLALETARHGITVNALCPGFTETPLLDGSLDTITRTTDLSRDQARAQLTGYNPQGRLIRPAEVAATALWLAGPDTGAITGQAISISGGEV